MESKYTKEERHKIYVKAKEWYIENRKVYNLGMCYTIARQIWKKCPPNNYTSFLKDNFPEFVKIKPAKIKHFDHYWWSMSYEKPEDKDIRIKKFDKLIKMTK